MNHKIKSGLSNLTFLYSFILRQQIIFVTEYNQSTPQNYFHLVLNSHRGTP